MEDEFYIGYRPRCPARLARGIRWMLGVLVALLFPALGWVALNQSPVGSGTFEFGHLRDWEGVVHLDPTPWLDGGAAHEQWLLVGQGKFGATESVRPLDGLQVRIRGTAIRDGGNRMIEVFSIQRADGIATNRGALTTALLPSVNEVILYGELVDTKCQFGVMRPGSGKVHRACAVRCLSGGVPPGILIRAPDGSGRVVVLTGDRGGPLHFDVEWAGLRVRAAGTLERIGDIEVLHVRSLSLE